MMTKLLHEAVGQIEKLDAGEQEAIARWLLDELASERAWDESLAKSKNMLAKLADAALAEHRAGRTRLEMDPRPPDPPLK